MLRGVKCVLGYIPLEDHQKCMLNNPGPPCGVSPTILQMIVRPNQERIDSGVVYSPSSIASCHRQAVLSRENDYYADVKQGYKLVRGSIVHKGLSQEPPYPGVLGVVRELRMKAPINTRYGEQVFHGQADEVVLLRIDRIGMGHAYAESDQLTWKNVLHVKIVDYKTRSEVGHDLIAPDKRHVHQVNQYAWLVKKFLPAWLHSYWEDENGEPLEEYVDHLFLAPNFPVTLFNIDEVVVDELSITYMDMKRPRTFTSKGFLYDQGKQLGDRINGHWVRRTPIEHEELELEPIHQFKDKFTESLIRKGIEEQIEAEQLLAPPLSGSDAEYMCRSCAVRQVCYDTGLKEGYEMTDQKPFVEAQ